MYVCTSQVYARVKQRQIPGSNQPESRKKKGTVARKRKSDTRWPEREATVNLAGVEEGRRQFTRG